MTTQPVKWSQEGALDIWTLAASATGPMLNGDSTAIMYMANAESMTVQLVGTAGAGFSINLRASVDGTNFNTLSTVTTTGFTNLGSNGFPFRSLFFRAEITAGDGTTSITPHLAALRRIT